MKLNEYTIIQCVTLMSFYFLIGCDNKVSNSDDAIQDTTFIEFQSLTIQDHNCFKIPQKGTVVIRTDSEWFDLWDNHWRCYDNQLDKTPPPDIDYQNEMVIGVFWGDNCYYSGCSNMSESIKIIYLFNDTMYVEIDSLQFLGECAACVEPLLLIRLSQNDYPAKFIGIVP